MCVRSGARQDEAAVGAERPGELEVKLEVEPLMMHRRSVLLPCAGNTQRLEVEALVRER